MRRPRLFKAFNSLAIIEVGPARYPVRPPAQSCPQPLGRVYFAAVSQPPGLIVQSCSPVGEPWKRRTRHG